jgi:hypothetical protein
MDDAKEKRYPMRPVLSPDELVLLGLYRGLHWRDQRLAIDALAAFCERSPAMEATALLKRAARRPE